MWTGVSSFLLGLSGLLMIFIILLQRGRGGGLAGAFGGAGGQSAFGTKAGDVFTKITIGLALVWVTMAGVTGFAMLHDSSRLLSSGSEAAPEVPQIGGPLEDAKNGKSASPFDTDLDSEDDESDSEDNDKSATDSSDEGDVKTESTDGGEKIGDQE